MKKIVFLALMLSVILSKQALANEISDQMLKGLEYINLEKYDQALSEFQNVSYSSTTNLHLCIGICYLNLDNFEDAVKEFKLEIKLNPELSQAYYFLAMINEYQARKEKAIFYWEKFIQFNKDENLKKKALKHIKYLKGK